MAEELERYQQKEIPTSEKFNKMVDAVNEHIASLDTLSTAVEGKADKQSVQSVTDKVSKNESDITSLSAQVAANSEAIEKLNELFGSGVEGYVRLAGTSDPAFTYKSYKHPVGEQSVLDCIKPSLVGNNYTGRVGEILHVLKPFSFDGVYAEDESGRRCRIDGTEGEVMMCNTRAYHMINGVKTLGGIDYEVFLRSYTPFEWHGVPSEEVVMQGMSPNYCVAHRDEDGVTRMHSCYNPEWDGSWNAMQGVTGVFVPTMGEDGVITEEYDADAKIFDSGKGLHTTGVSLPNSEQYAMNMNEDKTSTLPYYNSHVGALEIWFGNMLVEGGTWDAHRKELMGSGYCTNDPATQEKYWTEENGDAANGMKIQKADGSWQYYSYGDNSKLGFTGTSDYNYKGCMLNLWRSPWACLEQQRVLAYAVANNIPELTWFVFGNCKYKWRHVEGFAGPSQGVMTAVVWKVFATKMVEGTSLPTTGESIAGNRAEFLISSAIYRGVITDVSPSWWTSGLIFTIDDTNHTIYCEKDQAKLIKSEYGENVDISKVFQYELLYDNIGIIKKGAGYMRKASDKSLVIPYDSNTMSGGSLHSYTCTYKWLASQANAGKKSVRGFRRGYGASSSCLSPLCVFGSVSPSDSGSGIGFGTCVRLRNRADATSETDVASEP